VARSYNVPIGRDSSVGAGHARDRMKSKCHHD